MERGFDESIKKVYEAGEFEYKPANWTKLQEQLQKKKTHKLGMWLAPLGIFSMKKMMAAAAVVAAGMLMTGIYVNQKKPHESAFQHEPSSQNQPNVTLLDTTITETSQEAAQPDVVPTPDSQPTSVLPKIATHNHKHHFAPSINLKPASTEVANYKQQDLPNVNAASMTQKEEESLVSADVQHPAPAFNLNPDPTVRNSTTGSSYPNPVFPDRDDEKDHKISNGFSLTGSFGKGANSSMYAAGVNYQVNINQRFFVEGTLAFNSSNVQNVLSVNSTTSDIKFNSGATNGVMIPEMVYEEYPESRIKQMSYSHMAFNPSIGYQLTSKFSIKAGVDIQRQLNNSNQSSFIESGNYYKPLPTIDVGFTPKIGVQLSKHWISNLIYRKAINNVFSKTDFYNRNYFQLQLGYKF